MKTGFAKTSGAVWRTEFMELRDSSSTVFATTAAWIWILFSANCQSKHRLFHNHERSDSDFPFRKGTLCSPDSVLKTELTPSPRWRRSATTKLPHVAAGFLAS